MPEAYPTPAAGQRLTASLLRSMQTQTLRKSADTGRSATTTPAADPHLQLDVAASAVYRFHGWLSYDGLAAADIIVGFSVPTGALGTWGGHGGGITVTSATGGGGTQQDVVSTWGYNIRLETTAIGATRTYGCLGVGTPLGVFLYGTLRTAASAGTFALTWAQNASSATATTVYTDSYLDVLRVA
ncbi:hypothetical protein AB0M11_26665 [Streptomyces sp. NPDC051987]|uniref:hypothetical protein n=1 Tax=Streptomyces sp. NPDC051987 TaxID=3155808 RepID=UPI00341B113C